MCINREWEDWPKQNSNVDISTLYPLRKILLCVHVIPVPPQPPGEGEGTPFSVTHLHFRSSGVLELAKVWKSSPIVKILGILRGHYTTCQLLAVCQGGSICTTEIIKCYK